MDKKFIPPATERLKDRTLKSFLIKDNLFVLLKAFVILLIISTMTACVDKKAEEHTDEAEESTTIGADEVSLSKEQIKATGIILGTLEESTISTAVVANGVVDIPPQNYATVSVPVGGFVKSTDMLPGHWVKKGAVLAVMEHPEYIQLQQAYLQALSQHKLAQQELARQQELMQEDVGAGKKLQQAQADAKIAHAEVKSLEARLKMLNIPINNLQKGNISHSISLTSPIGGYIKTVNVNIGKYVNPSEVMFEIVDKDHMHIELKVFENDIFKIKEDQEILFNVQNQPDTTLKAKVYLIGKVFDNESRSVNVHGHLPDKNLDLIPGMYIHARILTGSHKASTLPEEAFVREGDQQYIFVRTKEQGQHIIFKKVAVKTGATEGGRVEIVSPAPFLSSSIVVVKGAYFLQAELMKEEGGEHSH